jgi:hypothetical protein
MKLEALTSGAGVHGEHGADAAAGNRPSSLLGVQSEVAHALDRPHRKIAPPPPRSKGAFGMPDQFRADSGLKAQEYSGPILGLIFLRFAAR